MKYNCPLWRAFALIVLSARKPRLWHFFLYVLLDSKRQPSSSLSRGDIRLSFMSDKPPCSHLQLHLHYVCLHLSTGYQLRICMTPVLERQSEEDGYTLIHPSALRDRPKCFPLLLYWQNKLKNTARRQKNPWDFTLYLLLACQSPPPSKLPCLILSGGTFPRSCILFYLSFLLLPSSHSLCP